MAFDRRSFSTVLLIVILACVVGVLVTARFTRVDFVVNKVAVSAQPADDMPFPVPTSDTIRSPDRPPPSGLDSMLGPPTNVVLLIGDGMGLGSLSTVSALTLGPSGGLAMESAPVIGLVRTWAANKLVTGSAASATAMATGFKTDTKLISRLPDGSDVLTLFEAAQAHDMATGVITTSGLVDATPAAFIAHADNRYHYHDILLQMLQSDTDVMIGGDFTSKKKAIRKPDYMELVGTAEMVVSDDLSVIRSEDQLSNARNRFIALFPPRAGQKLTHGPPLAVSVNQALEQLGQNPNGFILLVESEDIDEGAHASNVSRVFDGLTELNDATECVLDFAEARGDTLVLVTADHDTGSLSITSGDFDEATAEVRLVADEHLANWVPLFAWGPGAAAFSGVLDNTEIARRIAGMLELSGLPASSRHPAGG